jgi:hypothetical protein
MKMGFCNWKKSIKSQNQKGISFSLLAEYTCKPAFEIWGGMLFLQLEEMKMGFCNWKKSIKSQNQKGISFSLLAEFTCKPAFEIWGGMLFLQLEEMKMGFCNWEKSIKSQNQKGISFSLLAEFTCKQAFEIWGGMLFLQLCVLAKQRGGEKWRSEIDHIKLLVTHKSPLSYLKWCAFTLDIKSMLNEKSRWHPRWHPI